MSDFVWDHYNARGLTPEMVASSFVTPSQFSLVNTPRNTVVLGARGSGKTTILRMFEPRAQVSWAKKNIDTNEINSLGVFVPIDASWLASLRQTVSGSMPHVDWNMAALCIYSLAVARAVVDVMIYRTKDQSGKASAYGITLSSVDETKLCKEISKILVLSEPGISLRDLRFQITSDLAQFPQRLIKIDSTNQTELFSALSDPVLIASTACDLFNTLTSEQNRRWILLCDEIEIAPEVVRERLFRALRATPSPLILKLALTPVVKGLGRELAEQPLPSHDYDVVSLSYASKEDASARRSRELFCLAIWNQMCREKFPLADQEFVNAHRILEQPNLHGSIRRRGARSNKNINKGEDRYGKLFVELCKIDASFKEYLDSKSVDPEKLENCTPEQFDSVVRKVAPLAELRLFFLSGASSSRVLASRRSPTLYTGAKKIFQLSEGHPRWLKSTLGTLLTKVDGKNNLISIASQAAEIKSSVERLNSRIKAVPAKSLEASSSRLLDNLGDYFEKEVLGLSFKADPALSFKVDVNISEEISKAIEDSLFIGALIPMTEEVSGLMQDGVSGKRLRLSNWLAPHYRLPLIAGKSVLLSRILDDVHDDQLGLEI
jgi:hypothetical protein